MNHKDTKTPRKAIWKASTLRPLACLTIRGFRLHRDRPDPAFRAGSPITQEGLLENCPPNLCVLVSLWCDFLIL